MKFEIVASTRCGVTVPMAKVRLGALQSFSMCTGSQCRWRGVLKLHERMEPQVNPVGNRVSRMVFLYAKIRPSLFNGKLLGSGNACRPLSAVKNNGNIKLCGTVTSLNPS